MTESFPYAEPPTIWKKSIAVRCRPGTRWWEERGTFQHFYHWMRELQEMHPGNLIPLQWVPTYVLVTKAAVRQRAITGKLTVFSFILSEERETLLGRTVYRETRSRFDYATLQECIKWREEVFDRADEEWQAQRPKERKNRRKL